MGISYAYWNDSLEINTRITTGNIGVSFSSLYNLDVENGISDLTVDFNDDYTIMNISGKVSDEFNAFLHYSVLDHGSIPVIFKDQKGQVDNMPVQNLQHGMLDSGEKFYMENAAPQLHLFAKDPGYYEFEIEMLFEQWIK